MLLSKDQIFAAQDLQSVEVDVPEWGGSVRVQAMNAKDRIDFEKEQQEQKLQSSEIVTRLVLLTCVDEEGNRLFSNDDLDHLLQKSPNAILRVFNVSVKLNLINDDKIEQKAENFPQDHS